ncbi:MAG: DNA-directed RNA polymerase subunit omega [Thermodesulfobacteriota bacterium]
MARITIEDSLKKVESRFALVHIASQRARMLIKGAKQLVDSDNRPVVTALREISAGEVTMAEPDEKEQKKK